MASPVRRSRLIQRTQANVASLPAPVGGWNARDALANMAPTDAVTLDNLFPGVSSVTLRGGYEKHATGMTGQVETLMTYNAGASSKLYAVVGGKIYDVTTAGAVGAAKVTGLSNSRWEYTNITTSGGSYLYAANGVDKPLLFDGTTWTAIDGASTPAITGVTTTSLISPVLFKNRIWFIQKDTLKAWYLPTASVGGAAAVLDLSSVAHLGGNLIAMAAWTIDAGYGVDDNLVFVTDQGEVIVYRGTDPSSASTWALIGVWIVGAPISKRCLLKYGGDLLVLTLDGLIPMASALQSSRLDPNVALSDKIQGAFAAAAKAYKNNFGWGMLYHPLNNALIVNIPQTTGGQVQFVMNNITKAWCRFTNWNANCWASLNDKPYFGGNGYVAEAWTTDVGTSGFDDDGEVINTRALQAFNYFETRGVIKYFTRGRVTTYTNGQPTVGVGIAVDFQTDDYLGALSFVPTAYGLWDVGLFDQAIWGTNQIANNNVIGLSGIGYCGGIIFNSSSKNVSLEWASTDVVYQLGWAGI
jgi:hypothetical protein